MLKAEACNPTFSIGVDLGRKRDHSAIAVLERSESSPGYPLYLLRHAERLPLGTPYPRVVDRIRSVIRTPPLPGRSGLVVDATGVGAPIVDLLRAAGPGCPIDAVTITGAGKQISHPGNEWSVPRHDLIAALQIALEQDQLKIAKNLRESAALTRELLSLRSDRRETGEHDDLVLALALACWRAARRLKTITFGAQRIPGI